MDYWFDVFHYKNKDYLAIYSTSFEIYEIKETPLELQAELINEFLIVPGCRVTVKAENNIVAIRYHCHPVRKVGCVVLTVQDGDDRKDVLHFVGIK